MFGENVLKKATTSSGKKPTDMEFLMYFFLEKGIGYHEFIKLPIPYILSMLKTRAWHADQEEKQMKKAKRHQ